MAVRFLPVFLDVVLFFSLTVNSTGFTVSKAGDGQFTTIQAAVDAAGENDNVVILDTAVYEEQVTIDSTKNGLSLMYVKPLSLQKPVIRFKDTVNTGPKNVDEALVDSLITFERNGALRVIGASRIYIDGICIDGGGVFPFGAAAVWEGRYDMQHGNSALVLYQSGEVVVRDCDICNAYFGVYFKDRNMGGVFANPNPADVEWWKIVPFSGVNRTGNHLFEYNRVHDNSCGVFFESSWDMGSTIRYNLIYENHHPTAEITKRVKELTYSEGKNQTGGAFMFKDHLLSPVAIYNNTFWHCSAIFVGHWKAGGQHLVFNNIYGDPNEYWDESSTIISPNFEMSKVFVNRMHSCVYAAFAREPTSYMVMVTNDLKPARSTGGKYDEGTLISPFPESADVRWVETKFLSTDPQNEQFLVPDWGDSLVNEFIVDKGWEAAGVKDPDGSRADLGAIPNSGGRYPEDVIIRPTAPVGISGATATLSFTLKPRTGTVTDCKVVMLGMVTDLDTSSDIFGTDYEPIPAGRIVSLSPGTPTVAAGANTLTVSVPSTGDFAFSEMVIEGTASDGGTFITPVGFLPCRKNDYILDVAVLDKETGAPLTAVQTGKPVLLSVAARKGVDAFTGKVDPTAVRLLSCNVLATVQDSAVVGIPGGISGTATMEVVFSVVPPGGIEYVSMAGQYIMDTRIISFIGCSEAIAVYDPTGTAVKPAHCSFVNYLTVEVYDLKGRQVRKNSFYNRNQPGIRAPLSGSGAGVYLIRQTNPATGQYSLRRRVSIGR